jgi:hypothetical protein
MKTSSGSFTHNAVNPDQARKFRNQATGCGQTRGMSAASGLLRSMEVADHMPPEQRAALVPNSGYPAPLPAFEGPQEMSGFEDSTD